MASIAYLKNRRRWIVRWYVTVVEGPNIGQVIKGSRTIKTKELARSYAKEIDKKREYWRLGINCDPPSISEASLAFFKKIREFTNTTQYLYHLVLPKFIESLPAYVQYVHQINSLYIQNYLDSLRDKGRINRTLNCHLTVIKSFCKFISSNYEIRNPADSVHKLTEAPPDHRFFEPGEYEKSLRAGDEYYRRWGRFLANTGLRASEFCGLKWSNVNLMNSAITIVGKGRKRRVIPLNRTCRDILTSIRSGKTCNKENPIFISKSGRPVTRHTLYRRCRKTAVHAQMPVFGPHTLRHHFATELIRKKTPIAIISKLLGHASIRTTERIYIHLVHDDLIGQTDCLDSDNGLSDNGTDNVSDISRCLFA